MTIRPELKRRSYRHFSGPFDRFDLNQRLMFPQQALCWSETQTF